MNEAIRNASEGTAGVHLSFDLDVVDPEDAPSVGTALWGGITYREAHLAMEILSEGANRIGRRLRVSPPDRACRDRTPSIARA